MSGHADALRRASIGLLERTRTHAALTPALRAEHPAAVARLLRHISTIHFSYGDDADGQREFREAVRAYPAMLDDDELYWATICAPQPEDGKAVADGLDLRAAERRVLGALAACADGGPWTAAQLRRGRGRAYRALAQLAYGQRAMRETRRLLRAALRCDPALWRDRTTLTVYGKSLAGGAIIASLSRARRRR